MDPRAGGGGGDRPRKFFAALIGDLLEFAETEFKLGVRQPDGATLREHLENLERQTGMRDAMLDAAPCPAGAWYLWEYFLRMSARRTGNGYGPNALSSVEVEAWARLNGVRLAPFEAEALDGLEARFLSHYAKEMATK